MDGRLRLQNHYGDQSGSLSVTALLGQQTLLAGKAKYTICLQRAKMHVAIGAAGVTWSLKDGAGMEISGAFSAAVGPTVDPSGEYDFDVDGLRLTEGAALLWVPSASGAIGNVVWSAYYLPTSTRSVTDI